MACSSCGPGAAWVLAGRSTALWWASGWWFSTLSSKKSRQTPDRELKLARKRFEEVQHG
jgi:hypothetical protein